jgi:MinD-like ATPase involved in chromosome partitioning or flagellar assembly
MTPNEHDNPETSVESELAERETTAFYPFASGQPKETREVPGQPPDWLPDWQAPDQRAEGLAVEETAPELPVMEQLPGTSAFPEPGYPEMLATTPPPARLSPQLFEPHLMLPQPASPSLPASSPEPLPLEPPPLEPLPPEPSPEPSSLEPPPLEPPPLESLPLEPSSLEPSPPEPSPPDFGSGDVALPPVHDPADGPGARSWPQPPSYPSAQVSQVSQASQVSQPSQSSQSSQSSQQYEQPWTYQSTQRSVRPQPVWTPEPYVAPRAPEAAPPLRGPAVPWSEVRAGTDYYPASDPLAAPPAVREPVAEATGVAADVPPRETAETLTSDLLLPGKRATPDGGWRRTVYRASGGLIHVGESVASLRRRDLVDRVRTPVDGGHHRVAVLSLKGGVGKTTVTVGLGSTLASLRGDRVIAVDGNPDRGTLSDKVRLQTSATIRDLLTERARVRRYADVRAFTSQASSRLEILASDRDPGVSVAFSADDYRAVVGVLEHFYSICLTDCGTGLLHSAMAGILELADQVVLVSSPSVDGARSASATLDWLEAHDYGDLVKGGVVVLSAIRRKSKSTVDLNRLEQHFAARCRAVVRVPYDPHLEEGAEVELEMLNEETADAYLTLAALVADGFAHPGRSVSRATSGFPLA